MNQYDEHLESLHDIRKMMKESSQFLSLSGLSGIFAGIYALIGAFYGNRAVKEFIAMSSSYKSSTYYSLLLELLMICSLIILASIVTAFYFTHRKAKKQHQTVFNHTSVRLFKSMAVPLFTGGIFCFAILFQQDNSVLFIAPATLIFYGIALVSSAKYTQHDIHILGYAEILLGLIASFFLGNALLFWSLGFGFCHIIYGILMWYKFDRND